MAGSQISTSVTIISSLLGFQAVSLTALATSAQSLIAAGSKVEIASAFFTFGSNETPQASTWSAISTAATAYITLTPSGAAGSQTCLAQYSSTAPTWSTSKQGWYASAASVTRYIGGVTKGSATSYNDAFVIEPSQGRPGFYKDVKVGAVIKSALGGAIDGPIYDAEQNKRLWPTYIAFTGWDMNATDTHDVDLTVPDYRAIYSVTGRLTASAASTYFSIPHTDSSGNPQLWIDNINPGDVTLRRLNGGIFDNASYESATGVLLIWHGEVVVA